jgi:hypothetical protein
MRRIHPLVVGLVVLCGLLLAGARAQLNVNLEVKRRLYVRYEPVLVTVSITNVAGRDLVLEDGASQWFGFSVAHGDKDTIISPRNPDYKLEPLELKLGETVKRTINLNELYPINELGLYRVKANIYCKAYDKYFSTRIANIDVEDGHVVWKQTVGVPDTLPRAGEMHEYALLSAVGSAHSYLYARISDPSSGKVFGCYRLGHLLDGTTPDVQLDSTNTLHVLQLVGPKIYTLTQLGLNGEVYGQWIYDAPKVKPFLRRDGTGNLEIVGATRRPEPVKGATPAPKLSDRPPSLPKG